jgi:hypothetical protein
MYNPTDGMDTTSGLPFDPEFLIARQFPQCPVCLNMVDPTIDSKAVRLGACYFHGPCSRFAKLKDLLCDIGNIVGRPTTHYASKATQLEQQSNKLDDIFELVRKATAQ